MGRSSGLRTRFKVEVRTFASDGWPDTDDQWEPVGEVCADELPLRGYERQVANQMNSAATSKLRFRWSSNFDSLKASDRMVRIRDGKVYNFVSVQQCNNRFIEVFVVYEG